VSNPEQLREAQRVKPGAAVAIPPARCEKSGWMTTP